MHVAVLCHVESASARKETDPAICFGTASLKRPFAEECDASVASFGLAQVDFQIWRLAGSCEQETGLAICKEHQLHRAIQHDSITIPVFQRSIGKGNDASGASCLWRTCCVGFQSTLIYFCDRIA